MVTPWARLAAIEAYNVRMLDPAQWDQLHALVLSPGALMEGVRPGPHAAARTGAGGEFHDYRPYVPGDDLSRLDWKVFGRSDRYYIRRHRRETDLTLHLLVDASASMRFAGLDARGEPIAHDTSPTKLRYAMDVALALAFVAVRQADRAGAVVYDDALRAVVPVGATWPHLHEMRRVLGECLNEPAGAARRADIATAFRAVEQRAPGRSLVVVISDLLDDPAALFDGIDRLRQGGAVVVALGVLSPTELSIAHIDRPLRLTDPETRRGVDTRPASVARRYRQRLHEHLEGVRRGCTARGVGHHLLRTDEPVPAALRRALAV